MRGTKASQGVQNAGDVQRNARAHQHIADAGQHGAEDRRKVRHLHLLQEVDAHRIFVPLAGQIDLDEVAHNAQLDDLAHITLLVHGRQRVGHGGGLSAGDVVLIPNALGHLREGKCIQSAAHVAAGISLIQSADKERIERCAGDNAQLTEFGDRIGQAPVGNADPHATLNDFWKLHHL